MDRDEVALLLFFPLAGLALWLAARIIATPTPADANAGHIGAHRDDLERASWRQLLAPTWPAAIVFFVLAGWACADIEGPQQLGTTRLLAGIPFAFIFVRALVRAVTSVRAARATTNAGAWVVGLLRPRVRVSEELTARLTPTELSAVLLHEQAHARHRDPLRMLVARFVTDLQWAPFVAARAESRYHRWSHVVELARDAEAIERGAERVELASAIVKAAAAAGSSGPAGGAAAIAMLTSREQLLELRVRTLLGAADDADGKIATTETQPPLPRPRSSRLIWALGAFVLGGAFAIGWQYGQLFVPSLAT